MRPWSNHRLPFMKVIISIFPWYGDLQQHGGLQWVFSHKAPLAPESKNFELRVFLQTFFVLPWCSSNQPRGVAKKEELKKVKEAIVGKIDLLIKTFSWYKFLHTTSSFVMNYRILTGAGSKTDTMSAILKTGLKTETWRMRLELNWFRPKKKTWNESESVYCLAFSPCF